MEKLKEVSKAKHWILARYFPAWAKILGSRYNTLLYVDCFAGEGQYAQGEPGSPMIILQAAHAVSQRSPFSLHLIFVERSRRRAERLSQCLEAGIQTFPSSSAISFQVISADAKDFTLRLIDVIPEGIPAFFFIDPYGHPLPVPLINRILSMPRKEVLLVLMWYALNMHLNNPKVKKAINAMFGHEDWCNQAFMSSHGWGREQKFLEYFSGQLQAEYILPFRILFSPEDRVPGGEHRTKYYILHLSNHIKAVLLMKEVMWRLGDEEGTFAYSATCQQRLFSERPAEEELRSALLETFAKQTISFQAIREQTWHWPYIEKHYRKVIKLLEERGKVTVLRVESKRLGIRGRDLITFPDNA